ncbi:endonuclease/exonuclease/phosphatase family protein [Acanthamoeba castellanii str. Neff]|uniref:Endonuclease/exonuclease/phosphatase family protein n=1 Tax=Acanthamoeba castellanii (strain ATCC 30010 / Neff) TaxID=1257118 RepID=L8HGL4_ACACF|nr:endonuclease/exonuclease/phosphatase family protein [Acanthamoeba castellanii str. Neff]ELR24300.1 endonuclease/exonuclease/phosphatase family protein [Acanthamoeba castellanii str. Neff]
MTEAEGGGWRERARDIVGLVEAARPDVVCLQELWFNGEDAQQQQHHQDTLQDEESMLALFRRRLGDRYDFFGCRRPWGKADGCLTLVRTGRFVVEEEGHLRLSWLSARVAHCFIIVTATVTITITIAIAILRELHNLLAHLHALSTRRDVPIVLCGDFNAEPADPLYLFLVAAGFASSFRALHGREPGCTHRNHRGEDVACDYIWLRQPTPPLQRAAGGSRRSGGTSGNKEVDEQRQWRPEAAFLLPRHVPDDQWPDAFATSDHRPLYARYRLARL